MASNSKRAQAVVVPFLLLLVLCTSAVAQQVPQNPASASITYGVQDNGLVNAEIKIPIVDDRRLQVTDQASHPSAEYTNVRWLVLPIILEPNARIASSANIKISSVDSGRGFTLFVVIFPGGTTELNFSIDAMTHVGETAEGKAKFELDFSYPSMSIAERQLLGSPLTLSSFETLVSLPKKYDETEVNYDRSVFSTEDFQVFKISGSNVQALHSRRVWIVFPNPSQSSFNWAVIVLAFLVSSFGLLLHAEAFRERKMSRSIGLLVCSLVILIITAVFTYTLSKRLEFLIVATAAIPQVFYGFITSVYLLIASAYQVRIVGVVTVEGRPSEMISIMLKNAVDPNSNRTRKTRSGANGKYSFYLWRRATDDKYVITAKGEYAAESTGAVFQAKRGSQSEAPPLELALTVRFEQQVTSVKPTPPIDTSTSPSGANEARPKNA